MNVKLAIITDKPLDHTVKISLERYYQRQLMMARSPRSSIYASADEALANCGDCDYCVLAWEGTFVHSMAKLMPTITGQITEMNQKGDWLVAGQIIDQYQSFRDWNPGRDTDATSKWYFLWPIIAMVNVNTWRRLGSPKWGEDSDINASVLPMPVRSNENIHDNYTPLWIAAAAEPKMMLDKQIQVRKGWNMIRASIVSGLTVYNINPNIRRLYDYTYPENDLDRYNRTFQKFYDLTANNVDVKVLKLLVDNLHKNSVNATFNAFNSEPIGIRHHKGREVFRNGYPYIDTIVTPCQGFKSFVLAFGNECQAQHPVRFLHFDLHINVVKNRQFMIENWDGTLEWILKHNLVDQNENHERRWEEVLSKFNSHDHMMEQWAKYKSCEHYYMDQNLFNEIHNKKLTTKLKQLAANKIFFIYTDIFQWQMNYLTRGLYGIKQSESDFLELLKSNFDLVITNSKDLEDEKLYIKLIFDKYGIVL